MSRQKTISAVSAKKNQTFHKTSASRRQSPAKARRKSRPVRRPNWSLIVFEALALVAAAIMATMLVLGYSASWLSGPGFFTSLLPFAAGVVVLIVAAAVSLMVWLKLRAYLGAKFGLLPLAVALSLAAALVWFVMHDGYAPVFTHFRTLVGGKQQAARVTLGHQVYAAYRRYDPKSLQAMMERAQAFNPAIAEAAGAFEVDVHLLQGVAATESSFMPRDSHDGGHGLFQITSVPKFVIQQAAQALRVAHPQLNDARHNAFIAAATLKHYLQQMHDDLFLGLLAYNIGPQNGGLHFIMQQYGADDFVSMQPYLQQLPRDYPIRVLSYALAFKLWQRDGKLLAYEEGDNAVHIQQVGIPGL